MNASNLAREADSAPLTPPLAVCFATLNNSPVSAPGITLPIKIMCRTFRRLDVLPLDIILVPHGKACLIHTVLLDTQSKCWHSLFFGPIVSSFRVPRYIGALLQPKKCFLIPKLYLWRRFFLGLAPSIQNIPQLFGKISTVFSTIILASKKYNHHPSHDRLWADFLHFHWSLTSTWKQNYDRDYLKEVFFIVFF